MVIPSVKMQLHAQRRGDQARLAAQEFEPRPTSQ
jgi:hypothetical protein